MSPCEYCLQPLGREAHYPEQGVVWCRHCQRVYSTRPPVTPGARPPLGVPADLEFQEEEGRLCITQHGVPAWQLLGVAIVGALLGHSFLTAGREETQSFLGAVEFFGAIAGACAALSIPFQRTRLVASETGLQVRRSWFRARMYPRAAIDQLYAEGYVTGKGRTLRFRLCARERTGATRTLATASTQEEVLFLEQRLEERLGIEDAPVYGELVRRA